MDQEFSAEDFGRLQRFRWVLSRASKFERYWGYDEWLEGTLLLGYARGEMGFGHDDSQQISELRQWVPEDEEAFGALATILRWTTLESENVHYLKVIQSMQRLDVEANRDRIPPLLREALHALPDIWASAIDPVEKYLGYRLLTDAARSVPGATANSSLRELAELWLSQDVESGHVRSAMHISEPDPPSVRYSAAVIYFCRLLLVAQHTDLVRRALRANGLMRTWEPE